MVVLLFMLTWVQFCSNEENFILIHKESACTKRFFSAWEGELEVTQL